MMMMVMVMMIMMMEYPYVVLKVVVAARVLPESQKSHTVPAVGCTLLGQKQGGVPKLI